jgi:hypothetical protein
LSADAAITWPSSRLWSCGIQRIIGTGGRALRCWLVEFLHDITLTDWNSPLVPLCRLMYS